MKIKIIVMYILFVCNFLNAKEIINIRDWNHPTKEIFYNENIELKKVVINNIMEPVNRTLEKECKFTGFFV